MAITVMETVRIESVSVSGAVRERVPDAMSQAVCEASAMTVTCGVTDGTMPDVAVPAEPAMPEAPLGPETMAAGTVTEGRAPRVSDAHPARVSSVTPESVRTSAASVS
ncbi:MAG: hypothetical protein ACE10G_13325 [Gemmatimonadales bacterium]